MKKQTKPTAVEALMPAIVKLSVRERRKLIVLIEGTLLEEQEPIVLQDWQKKLLDERLAEMEANPGGGIPWREVMDELRKRR